MGAARIGVDVGGTFTDLVALARGRLLTVKVPSTPRDQSEGVLRALAASGIAPADVGELRHGTTVATNALLERRGARTALVTTEGFRDVLEIGRQNRPSLYDLTRDRPPPLVPRELRFAVRERMGPRGELEPLDEPALRAALARISQAGVEAVAVCFLFAYLHPAHERRAGELAREALPDAHVALASEVLPQFREYERFATTAASAYLGPRLVAYLGRLAEEMGQRGYPPPLVMQSSGGVASVEEAVARAGAVVLSGPAGGAVGAAEAARAAGHPDALTLDMGGTSADVALVRGGAVATTTETLVAGVPIAFPAVDVHTVGAGGGSIAWVDDGGALRVGPHSAGAEPGPASYGRGGAQPTVTDAHLVVGSLEDGMTLGGAVTLRRELAESAVAGVGRSLGIDPVDAARAIVRVANAELVRALRVVSVERGVDPRGLALVAFGGAGPLHGCALADELGMRAVLVPRAAGVLSARGLALADVRRDVVAPAPEGADVESRFRELEASAARGLGGAELERHADVRYRGQGFELTVAADDAEAVGERFHAAHAERYGYRIDDAATEVVALRVTARVSGGETELAPEPGGRLEVEGPTLVELPEATCFVAEGWRGATDDHGTLVLVRG
jgi:N-methylhydantoinase A